MIARLLDLRHLVIGSGFVFWMIFSSINPLEAASSDRSLVLVVDRSQIGLQHDVSQHVLPAAELAIGVSPTSMNCGVVAVGEKAEVAARLRSPWTSKRLREKFAVLRRQAHLGQELDLDVGLLEALRLIKKKRGSKGVILAVVTNPAPLDPIEKTIKLLKKSEVRLHVVALKAAAPPIEWEKAAQATGGILKVCDVVTDLERCLLDAFMVAAGPQQLPLNDSSFQIDPYSRIIRIVARSTGSVKPVLLGPGGIRIDAAKPAMYGRKGIFVQEFHFHSMFQLKNPKPGNWKIEHVDLKGVNAFIESQQRVEVLVPRRRFVETELLPVAAYLARKGVVVKLPGSEQMEGFVVKLVNDDGDAIASSTMLDDGSFPDARKGDGVYSVVLPLNHHTGMQTIQVEARTQALARRRLERIEVMPGNWVEKLEPADEIEMGRTPLTTVMLSQALPLDSSTVVMARLGSSKEYLLKQARGNPYQWGGLLPTPTTPGHLTLHIFKRNSSVPWLRDEQSVLYPIRVKEALNEEVATSPMVVLFVLLVVLNSGAMLYMLVRYLRRPKPVLVQETGEFEPEDRFVEHEVEESIPDSPEPVKMRVEARIITPEAEKHEGVVSNVGERLGEVLGSHIEASEQDDIVVPDFSADELDRDSDSEWVTGDALDRVQTWFNKDDKPEDSDSRETGSEDEQPDSEEATDESDLSAEEVEEEIPGEEGKPDAAESESGDPVESVDEDDLGSEEPETVEIPAEASKGEMNADQAMNATASLLDSLISSSSDEETGLSEMATALGLVDNAESGDEDQVISGDDDPDAQVEPAARIVTDDDELGGLLDEDLRAMLSQQEKVGALADTLPDADASEEEPDSP